MSSLTVALYQALQCDLSDHLDPYQLASVAAGKSIWPDATLTQAKACSIGVSLLKKYNEEDLPSAEASERALDKFLKANNRSKEWKLHLADLRDEELWNGVKTELYNFWYEDGYSLVHSYEELFMAGGTGPGASVKARGTDFFTKVFDSPLSYTGNHLLNVWEKLVSRDHRWQDAHTSCISRHKPRLVEGNKLSFVNKNVTVARCISTEPTINMWFQLGLGRIVAERLKKFYGIDLANQQEINRVLAQTGSEWGLYSTIDLESASDTVSYNLCKEVLPQPFFDWLNRIRSPTVTLPDGRVEELGMISTMGNGVTFPLQTLIFSAVVATVYRHLGIPLRERSTVIDRAPGLFPSKASQLMRFQKKADQRKFGVFGDDIIVHRDATRLTYRLLDMLGFIVNESKSYVEGPFRESCGGDYFNGHPIRGVYIKRLKSSQDYYVAINSLNRWSALTGIGLRNTVTFLMKHLRDLVARKNREIKKHNKLFPKKRKPLLDVLWCPPDENDDSGVHVPLDKARGIKHLEHGIQQYRRDVVLADTMTFLTNEDGEVVSIVVRKGEARRNFNPVGLWLSFLLGGVRGYRINLRQREVRYTTKRRITSKWDTLSPRCPTTLRWWGWSRWSDAASSNLNLDEVKRG